MIRLWRGFHSKDLPQLISQAWEREELLVLCPPGLKDFSFVDLLPEGELKAVGEWATAPAQPPSFRTTARYREYPEKPVLGVFTSGTASGSPRLVLYSKANLIFSLNGVRSFFDCSRFDTIFCYPQPFHTFGLVLGVVHAVLHGLKFVTGEGKYTREFHRLRLSLKSSSVLTLGTPAHFHDLVQYVKAEGASIEPSYSCIMGGAKVSVNLWRSVRDVLKIEAPSTGYGATEACPAVTHLTPGKEPREEGEIGIPLMGLNVELKPDAGLEFGGPGVCLALIEKGELCFPRSILLKDEVRKRSDGIYVYEGRKDLLLNRGGQKFSLEKIEECIRAHSRLDTVCVPVPDERLGEELGILVRNEGPFAIQDELRLSLMDKLQTEFGASFNMARWLEVEQFPLNESFKIDRKQSALWFQRDEVLA